jgi:hypothetical protein
VPALIADAGDMAGWRYVEFRMIGVMRTVRIISERRET